MAKHAPWVSPPEFSDEAVIEATGRGWDEWRDLIEAWPGHTEGHAAIALHLESTYDEVDLWWSQTITVGFERITGLRLPHQRADGTFTASKAATVDGDAVALRRRLLDEQGRRELFADQSTELKSKPDAKAIRIAIGPGVAHIALEEKPDGRVKITVAHNKLPAFDDVATWKSWWTNWLTTL